MPYENEQPIPLTIPKEDGTMPELEYHGSGLFDEYGIGLGLMAGNGSSNEAQEACLLYTSNVPHTSNDPSVRPKPMQTN